MSWKTFLINTIDNECSLVRLQMLIQCVSFQCSHAAISLLYVLTSAQTCTFVYEYSKAKVTEGDSPSWEGGRGECS